MKTLVAAPIPPDLSAAQNMAWLHQPKIPDTSREALGRVLETARLTMTAFEQGQLVHTQSLLEDTLIQTLVAMRSLDVNPDQALQRGLNRLRGGDGPGRSFHIFTDRVEIRVNGELRGGWTLYSQADYDAAMDLARDLECDVIHEEAYQLGLFNPVQQTGQPDP